MPRMSVPATGWYVEVDLPSGTTVRPDVVGDPSRNPTANGYPTLEVPVRKRELWLNIDLSNSDVPMRVWFDGRPQPVDRLERVQQTADATVTLSGRGGIELDTRDERSVAYDPAHTVAENIITAATSYTANVDRPNTTVEENQIVQTADTQTEWEDLSDDTDQYSPTMVISTGSYGDGDVLTVARTCRVRETNDIGDKTVSTLVSDTAASNDDAVNLATAGDYVELDWNADYTFPSGDTKLAYRIKTPDDPDGDGSYETPDIDVFFNGDLIGGFVDGADRASNSWGWQLEDPPDGDHSSPTFRVECNGNAAGADFYVDLMAIYDGRFHDGTAFDNDTSDSSGYLSSPTEYPVGATKANYPSREFASAQTVDAVVGGRSELDVDDKTGIQEIALSNDRGETWSTSAADVATYEVDFADVGPSLRQRLTLAGTDDTRTTATPTQGYIAPEIDSYTLKADLEDLPLVVDQSFDDSAMGNLQQIANELGDFVFEFRVAADGTESVEFTVPGQRSTTRQDPISEYEATETIEPVVERVVVKGSSRRTEGESFTANVGTWVDLTETDVQLGRSVVTDPSTGAVFTEGVDYDIDPQQGRVQALASGDLVDGASYEIDYSFRPSGTATVDGASADPRTEVVDLSALPSDRACRQVAARILEQVDEPLEEALVTVPSDRSGWQIVEAVSFDVLPFDNLEVRNIENTPAQTVFRLGSRESVGEVVGRLRTRLNAVSRRA